MTYQKWIEFRKCSSANLSVIPCLYIKYNTSSFIKNNSMKGRRQVGPLTAKIAIVAKAVPQTRIIAVGRCIVTEQSIDGDFYIIPCSTVDMGPHLTDVSSCTHILE